MEDAIRKFLGIRKESWLSKMIYWISRLFTFKALIIAFIVLALFFCFLLFAKYELMARPEVMEALDEYGVSPYFVSFFWVIGTLAVGYAESPMTTIGRLLDLFIILVGVTAVAVLISQITTRLVSANLGNMFGMSKTRKKIDYILCGWNPISEATFNELKGSGIEIVVIDPVNRPELAKAKGLHFIMGDPTNPTILKRANAANAKNIVLAMEEDSDVLLAIHVIRDLNPWINIVAKINNHEHIKIAESAGADQVVSPPSIGGRLLSMVSEEPAAVDWVIRATAGEKGLQLFEYDVTKESAFANKTVGHVRTQLKDKAKIISIDTAKGMEKLPGDELVIEPGNKIIMLADMKKLNIEP